MKNNLIVIVLLAAVCLCVSGCNDHSKKKQAMVDKWEYNKAMANMPVIEDLILKGQFKKAKQMLDESMSQEPDLYMSHFLMGQIHYMTDDLEKSEKCFKRSVELEDAFDKGWYWLGEVGRAENDLNAAVKNYKRAVELSPDNMEYVISLGHAYADKGDYDDALDVLDRKIKKFGSEASLVIAKADILVACGKKDEVVKVYQRALLSNSDSVELLEGLGYCYMGRQDWDKAEEIFERLMKISAADGKQVYLQILSDCCMNTGQYNKALGYLDKLNSVSKDDAEYWLKAGQAALGAKEGKRAIFCANRSLYLKPGWADAYILLGCGSYMVGEYQKGLDALSKVPDNLKQTDLVRIMTDKCLDKMGTRGQSEQEVEKVSNSEMKYQMLSFGIAEVQ